MKNKFSIFLLVAASFCLTACGSSNVRVESGVSSYIGSNSASFDAAVPTAGKVETAELSGTSYDDLKLIRRIDVSMEIPSEQELNSTISELNQLISKHKGIATSQNTNLNTGYAYGYFEARIPKVQADVFLSDLQNTGNSITRINDTSEDVTEHYIDTETRLKVKMETRDKYMSYLEEAQTVEEVLQIEDRLNAVIADIESYQATLNSLKNQVEYTSVSIQIDCKTSHSREPFSEKLQETLDNITENASNLFLGGIEWFVSAVIVLIFFLPILFVVIKFIKFAFSKGKSIKIKKSKTPEVVTEIKTEDKK